MPNYTKERLGIIGGCGVAAANELVCRMEKRLTELGCVDDSQQPETILFQAAHAPDRIAFAAGRSENSFVPYFIDVGRKLKMCGATICCIPCNTAHCAIDEIESGVGVPFIDIIDCTLRFIVEKHPSARKVGLLCSSGTKVSRVYQKHADGFPHEFLFPRETLQRSVDDGIFAVKRGLRYTSPVATREFFVPAAADLIDQGADVMVL
ncbi:MAG: amino acid racemase, partial [Puniceicoccales bacterium]|nr:amino acid racemase [Puniceicoccales bacterium]